MAMRRDVSRTGAAPRRQHQLSPCWTAAGVPPRCPTQAPTHASGMQHESEERQFWQPARAVPRTPRERKRAARETRERGRERERKEEPCRATVARAHQHAAAPHLARSSRAQEAPRKTSPSRPVRSGQVRAVTSPARLTSGSPFDNAGKKSGCFLPGLEPRRGANAAARVRVRHLPAVTQSSGSSRPRALSPSPTRANTGREEKRRTARRGGGQLPGTAVARDWDTRPRRRGSREGQEGAATCLPTPPRQRLRAGQRGRQNALSLRSSAATRQHGSTKPAPRLTPWLRHPPSHAQPAFASRAAWPAGLGLGLGNPGRQDAGTALSQQRSSRASHQASPRPAAAHHHHPPRPRRRPQHLHHHLLPRRPRRPPHPRRRRLPASAVPGAPQRQTGVARRRRRRRRRGLLVRVLAGHEEHVLAEGSQLLQQRPW